MMAAQPLAKSGEALKAGPIGLVVILLLCIACYYLFKSMSKHMRNVRENFPAEQWPSAGPTRPVRPTRPPRNVGQPPARITPVARSSDATASNSSPSNSSPSNSGSNTATSDPATSDPATSDPATSDPATSDHPIASPLGESAPE